MKLFRNRIFALVLCIITVLGSTALSARVRLAKEAEEVTEVFYSGVKKQPSLASSVSGLCSVGEDIAVIAESCGIDTASFNISSRELSVLISGKSGDIEAISGKYSSFLTQLKVLREKLLSSELTARQENNVAVCSQRMDDALALIAENDYNSRVDALSGEYSRFPASLFVKLFHIVPPAKFE